MKNAQALAAMVVGLSVPLTSMADPKFVPFAQCLDAYVQKSNSLMAKSELLEGFKQRSTSARLGHLPTLSGNVTQSQTNALEPSAAKASSTSLGFSLGLNLFQFGGVEAQRQAVTLDTEARTLEFKSAILGVEQEGVKRLLEFLQTSLSYDVVKKIHAAKTQSVNVAKLRFQKGLIPAQEVEKLDVELALSEASLRSAQAQHELQGSLLQSLVGDLRPTLNWPWKDFLAHSSDKFHAKENNPLATRPDLKAAELAVDVSQKRMDASWAGMLPSLDGAVGYSKSLANGAVPAASGLTTSVTLTVPLFDKFERYGQYRGAFHDKEASLHALDDLRQKALSEYLVARKGFVNSLDTAQLREKLLVRSQKLYQDSLSRFEKGLISVNELLLDANRAYDLELAVVDTWYRFHLDTLSLCQASGFRVGECLVK